MTEHDEARLPGAAEALLESWPAPERDDAAWDELAGKVEAKIADTSIGSTADDLLAAPLPAGDDEGSLDAERESGPRVRDSDAGRPSNPGIGGRSLAEIAASVTTAKKDEREDDIARESLSLASRSRPSASEIAATLSARRSSPSIPPPSAPAPSVEPAAPAPVAAQRSRSGALVGGAIAVLALAAAVVIMVGNRKSAEPAAVAIQETATAPAAQAAPAGNQPAKEQGVVELDQLPGAAAKLATPDAPGAAHAAGSARPAAKVAGGAASAGAPAEAITLAETPEPAAPPTTQAAKEDPSMHPAAGENVPEKPASGEVQAAVASVLGGARACVAGQDEPSHAVIVFGSDGRVQSVSVSGPAAGTPSAGCIRSALSHAHVHRFARPSFTVATPIRP